MKQGLLQYEKKLMFPWDWVMSYIATPVYVMLSLGLIAAAVILLEMDEQKNMIPAICCFGVWLLLSVVLLAAVPVLRKKSMEKELAWYDFECCGKQEQWIFLMGQYQVEFDEYGMYIDGQLHYYNHISKRVCTDNAFRQIRIWLSFATDTQEITMPLQGIWIQMIRQLEIRLDNMEELEYLLEHKEAAFRQIYNTGKIKIQND